VVLENPGDKEEIEMKKYCNESRRREITYKE
jgi:hypothetical protein